MSHCYVKMTDKWYSTQFGVCLLLTWKIIYLDSLVSWSNGLTPVTDSMSTCLNVLGLTWESWYTYDALLLIVSCSRGPLAARPVGCDRIHSQQLLRSPICTNFVRIYVTNLNYGLKFDILVGTPLTPEENNTWFLCFFYIIWGSLGKLHYEKTVQK